MMMMIESAMAVRFSAGVNLSSAAALPCYRSMWSSEDSAGVNKTWNRVRNFNNSSITRRKSLIKGRIRASLEHLGAASDPVKPNGRQQYHPFEEIGESTSEISGDARLTAAETTRTIIEVNSKATMLLSALINDEVEENIIWPDLPYVTDEHGNLYFQVNNNEDVLQSLTSENNFVQVIIGLDTMDMIDDMELSGPAEIDFGIEEIEDGDSDVEDDEDEDEDEDDDNEDDDYDEDWVSILEDTDDQDDSDETLGDWAKLETMRSSHPMYFAKKVAEIASDDSIDWMEKPPVGLVIQGLLRPAFIEEHSVIQKHKSGDQPSNDDISQVDKVVEEKLEDIGLINGHGHESVSSNDGSIRAEELEKDESLRTVTSYYKVEMVKIQLISAHGHPTVVEVEDFSKAQPDAIAHSAAKIISRLKAGGEKTTQALKSLCWRCKGIQVEEATLITMDSLGFDLRVCSGTQIQTLRFAFSTQATSEYSAERQLNDLLFPRNQHKPQKTKQTHQNEL